MSISTRTGGPTGCATRSTRICGRIRSRCCRPRRWRTGSTRASRRRSATISIASSTAAPDLALDRLRAWRVPRRLDADAMHAAAQRLVGKHDFTTFRSTECQAKSPVKTLDQLDVIARRRRDPDRDVGALVPAQSGALDGRLAGAGRRRQMERRRSCRRARGARPRGMRARWRRPRGFIWCAWIIEMHDLAPRRVVGACRCCSPARRARRAIPGGRCASSCRSRPAARPTCSAACSPPACRRCGARRDLRIPAGRGRPDRHAPGGGRAGRRSHAADGLDRRDPGARGRAARAARRPSTSRAS